MGTPDFEIVTAVTPDYYRQLKWTLPTWLLKPQFRGRKLHVFHHGFDNPEKDLAWIGQYFERVECHEWAMKEYDNQRELMLSCFVLGSVQVVKADYWVKIDADSFCVDAQDVYLPEDFEVDLASHKWGYTKPAWWIDKLDAWTAGKKWNGDMGDKGHRGARRIQSISALHRTSFVRRIAALTPDRLPIPSHDSYLWYMAERFPDCSWHSFNMKKRGLTHTKRWKNIREAICSSPAENNGYLNR